MNERFGTDGLPVDNEQLRNGAVSVGTHDRIGLLTPAIAPAHRQAHPRCERPNPIPHFEPHC
jgi:hypothetical protein